MARVKKGYQMAIVKSRDPLGLEVVPASEVVSFQAAESWVRHQGITDVEYVVVKLAKDGQALMVKVEEIRKLRSPAA